MRRFNWRYVEVADYDHILVKWWNDWGWPEPPHISTLPSGVLVYDELTATPLYAGFLYDTGTPMGWMEYTISNKDASIDMKRGAFQYMEEVISVIAKSKGMSLLFTSTNNMAFANTLKKSGYDIGDVNMVQLIKRL